MKAKPARPRQKDRDARWSVKYTKVKVKEGAGPKAFQPAGRLAIPMFGYKNHIGIGRAQGLIRTWEASAANAHDGARLPDLISTSNTGSGVWADTACRSKKNEAFLAKGMFTSHIHQKKPPRQPVPGRIARANAKRSAVLAWASYPVRQLLHSLLRKKCADHPRIVKEMHETVENRCFLEERNGGERGIDR